MRVSNGLRLHSIRLSRIVSDTILRTSDIIGRMAKANLPLLWGVCVILQQCHNVDSTSFEQSFSPGPSQGAYHLQDGILAGQQQPVLSTGQLSQILQDRNEWKTGSAQFYEPYKIPQSVSTSFINQPISSINPYSKFETGVERNIQSVKFAGGDLFTYVDSTSFVQPFSSGLSQGAYKLQGQRQPFLSTGQLSQIRQQPSSVEYIPVAPETRAITTSQQLVQPNFVYTLSNQGQLASDVERTDPVSLPVQRESAYSTGGQYTQQDGQYMQQGGKYVQQSAHVIPLVQFTPKFVPSRTLTAAPPTTSEEVFPLTNSRLPPSEGSQTIFIGGKPFVITTLKPKAPPVSEIPSVRNPLESLKAEVLQSLLNKLKGDGVRTKQIVVNTNSDSSTLGVTETSQSAVPTTPDTVTVSTTVPPPSPTPTTQETTQMPTPSPTTTTTLPPPPPVHTEVTTTEERYYVSKKKKITIAIRVEDAGPDAVEKDYYSTDRNSFYDWTKTILEPTNTYETTVYMKNETREVEGPSLGLNVTKFICRSFVDGEEIQVVEQDSLRQSTTCPQPESIEGESWQAKVFTRVENEVHKKLGEIFNVPEMSSRPSEGKSRRIVEGVIHPSDSETFSTDSNTTPDFLTKTLNAFKSLNLDKPHYGLNPLKRDIETPRHLVDIHNFLPTTTEAKMTSEIMPHHEDLVKTTPNQTSKRETKAEVFEEVKLEQLKPEEIVTEAVVPTSQTHIMFITKTPPVRPPHPYPHPTTTPLPHPAGIESLPVPQALRPVVDHVPPKTEDNKEATFFRRLA